MNVKKSLIDFVTSNKQQILGWTAVGLSTVITCSWAMWGILENFHEGWYYESFLSNLGMMFRQYLSPMLIFMGVTLVSIYWPRLGGSLHVILSHRACFRSNQFRCILPFGPPCGMRGDPSAEAELPCPC